MKHPAPQAVVVLSAFRFPFQETPGLRVDDEFPRTAVRTKFALVDGASVLTVGFKFHHASAGNQRERQRFGFISTQRPLRLYPRGGGVVQLGVQQRAGFGVQVGPPEESGGGKVKLILPAAVVAILLNEEDVCLRPEGQQGGFGLFGGQNSGCAAALVRGVNVHMHYAGRGGVDVRLVARTVRSGEVTFQQAVISAGAKKLGVGGNNTARGCFGGKDRRPAQLQQS